MSSLIYVYRKILAVLIRAIATRGKRIPATPDGLLQIKSREAGRSIKTHVYQPPGTAVSSPAPVLVNFHGSGFLIPLHGSDDEFCRQISRETGYTVLDVQYRLAPEHPFPAALHDVEDAVNWVLQQPDKFDLSRVAVSGFSAGGNLALAASCASFPRETFRSVLAFYPPLDLYTDPGSKSPPDPAGKPLPTLVTRFFNKCYIPSPLDARDPRISPCFAHADRFPNRVLIVTAAGDNLAVEAEKLAAQIEMLPDRQVVSQRMQGCNHAWDKKAPPETIQGDAKDKAYAMAVAMLLR
ncbi:putative esterase/lipase [Aspergillus clavatus NRRL 1]|uniref:Esterase/lipase, putative n=1 Tax=Aspergillus clavatus (strain ATCC 1007 / CBS 513.65 / DSM 816 / NCTC 3887 / NRRL 1 / QM 1276 / 107) TaxID=344612 RepID=A1CJJ2_ASPCL|nr:esterase/lipase, putative [Aspergillus clavatus NRRL 1]EAW09316.1 esterase/lipase, putative [Aspergillus clavatus NRRL 1]